MAEWKPSKKKVDKKVKRRLILGIIGAVVAFLLIFWALFYITKVEVIGNTRYTSEEVEEMALSGFLDHNSWLLSTFHGKIDLEDIPFMEYVEVEYLSRNSVRLHVTEKYPVGYIRSNGYEYYFDKDGIVLEILQSSEEDTTADGTTASAASTSDGTTASATSTSDGTGTSATSTAAATTEAEPTVQVSQTSSERFHPALTDVPRIEGLTFTSANEGDQVTDDPDSVFNTILALTRMLSKYSIEPDYVQFDEDYNMTLYYGSVRIALGADSATDSNLEDKMARAAAILPQLDGLSGVLHLENFSEDTVNIVFDQD